MVVGQVIMDKNPGVTCVVNKTNIIDTTYRNFKMEVLAGEENMVAKVGLHTNVLRLHITVRSQLQIPFKRTIMLIDHNLCCR